MILFTFERLPFQHTHLNQSMKPFNQIDTTGGIFSSSKNTEEW